MKNIVFIISIIIIFSSFGFVRSNPSKNWLLFNRDNSPLTSNKILSIVTDKQNGYWIVTGVEYSGGNIIANGYLHRLHNGNWEIFDETNSPLKKNIVADVAITSDGKILIATFQGLYIKNNNNWDSLNTGNSPLPDNFIHRVTVDKLNRYWLGIPNYCIALYDHGNWTIFDDMNSFLGIADFNFIKFDSLNHIWIGTDYYGLYAYDGNQWRMKINSSPFGPFNPMRGFAVDSLNQKWITTPNKIAVGIDTPFVFFDSSQIGFPFYGFSYDASVIDRKKVKYFGTTDGLLKYDGATWTKYDTSNSPIPVNGFRYGYADSKNNKIFGLYSRHPQTLLTIYDGLIFFNEDSVIITSTAISETSVPSKLTLYQNYPNPFNPTTKIKYYTPRSEIIIIKVYDVLGREIKTLINEYQNPGVYEIELDASGLSDGVYFYSIRSESYLETKKMILLR